MLIKLVKLPVHRIHIHMVIFLKVVQEQLNRVVTSRKALVVLVDLFDLNTTQKLVFFCLGVKICAEENYLARRCLGEMKLGNKIPLRKWVLVFVTIRSTKSLPQVVQEIFVAVHVNFGSN